MKLYATTTSERASKGQGGNKFIDVLFTGETNQPFLYVKVRPIGDYDKDNVIVTVIDTRKAKIVYDAVLYNPSKGKQKKDETYEESITSI